MTEPAVPVRFEHLRQFIAAAFERLGLRAADALTVAALMAEADLQGSDGHGVIRLPQYARRIKAGGVNPRPDIRVVQERAGMAPIHGDNGMGHLVMERAARLAIEKARVAGVAWVGSQWSNHAGPASLYARMPLAHDMIGLYFASGTQTISRPGAASTCCCRPTPSPPPFPPGPRRRWCSTWRRRWPPTAR